MGKIKYMYTAEEFYEEGKDHYKLAIESEGKNKSKYKIDDCWGLAATEFWFSLTLGSEKAPLALFKIFWQGVGVKKDDDIVALMYGAALQLTPEDCAKLPADSRPEIPSSMQPRIAVLVKLVKQAHAQIPAKGVNADAFNDQLTKFNNDIKLPGGKLIQSYFTEKTTTDINRNEVGGASTSRFDDCVHPLEPVDETAITGRDAEDSSCCVVM